MTLVVETPLPLTIERARLRQRMRAVPAYAFAIDLVVALVAGTLAAVGRDSLSIFRPGADVTSTLDVLAPLMIMTWLVMIAAVGGYQRDIFGAGPDEYKRLVHAAFLTAAIIGIACFLLKIDLSRGFYFLALLTGVPSMIGGRALLRRYVKHAHRNGNLLSRVIISGTPSHVDEVARVLRREKWLGYDVVGALTPGSELLESTPGGIPVLGRSTDIKLAVDEVRPEVVFFADNSLGSGEQMRKVVWELEAEDVQVVVAPSVTDISQERVRLRPVGGLPFIHIGKPRAMHASRSAKRTFDVVGACALIVMTAPLIAAMALCIKLHDGGPVLFRQSRVGRNSDLFQCFKFRTMVTDAEAGLAELHAAHGHEGGGLFKVKDDPRITKPGRWLRRTSLDELPQLFNVLRGDMSLVGPRPGLPSEAEHYTPAAERRLRVRPGMTGLWQVSGRSDLSYDEAVRLDLYYVDNWSMLQDLSILSRTVGAVLGSRGAY